MQGRQSAFTQCARPELVDILKAGFADLGGWPTGADKLPVVYHEVGGPNIGFLGLERLHPFDSKKYGKVLAMLEREGVLRRIQVVPAAEASREALLSVHEEGYLHELEHSPRKVAEVTELGPLAALPSWILRRKVLKPMRYMAGGSMLAAGLALQYGWAINLGGGMHHAHRSDGGGWCVYDDAMLAIRRLRAASGGRAARRTMFIDLDVHQGNGVARDKLFFEGTSGGGEQQPQTYIMDVFNADVYPRDGYAKQGIDLAVELRSGAGDGEYIDALSQALRRAFREFPSPDLVVYNAGTDVLDGDPLGLLRLSAAGVAARDEAVWEAARAARAPVVMLLSGGYTAASTPCIAASIASLFRRFSL